MSEEGPPAELLESDGAFAALFGERSLRLPARSDSGLARLAPYLKGRWGCVAWMVLIAAGGAAARRGGWILVSVAIDNGISNSDERYLIVVVIAYLAVAPSAGC